MEKLAYKTPSVEITKWSSQDIITTSGGLSSSTAVSNIAAAGDTNVTASAIYTEIQ